MEANEIPWFNEMTAGYKDETLEIALCNQVLKDLADYGSWQVYNTDKGTVFEFKDKYRLQCNSTNRVTINDVLLLGPSNLISIIVKTLEGLSDYPAFLNRKHNYRSHISRLKDILLDER